jgi:hypothetical protein
MNASISGVVFLVVPDFDLHFAAADFLNRKTEHLLTYTFTNFLIPIPAFKSLIMAVLLTSQIVIVVQTSEVNFKKIILPTVV